MKIKYDVCSLCKEQWLDEFIKFDMLETGDGQFTPNFFCLSCVWSNSP